MSALEDEYLSFGKKIKSGLGVEGVNMNVVQLSDIISKQQNQKLFLERIMKICIPLGIEIPTILPGEKEFEMKAMAILTGMMSV